MPGKSETTRTASRARCVFSIFALNSVAITSLAADPRPSPPYRVAPEELCAVVTAGGLSLLATWVGAPTVRGLPVQRVSAAWAAVGAACPGALRGRHNRHVSWAQNSFGLLSFSFIENQLQTSALIFKWTAPRTFHMTHSGKHHSAEEPPLPEPRRYLDPLPSAASPQGSHD